MTQFCLPETWWSKAKETHQTRELFLIFQFVVTCLNVADVVTDILVIHQFARDNYTGEMYASIIIFSFNTMFQTFLGLFVEASENKNRYASNNRFNLFISILISFCQMRLVVETYFIYRAWRKIREEENAMEPNIMLNSIEALPGDKPLVNYLTRAEGNNLSSSIVDEQGENREHGGVPLPEFERRSQIRAAIALMQGVFQNAPQIILQVYVILFYSDTDGINIMSVVLSALALSGSLAVYSCKEDSFFTQMIAGVYVLGQLALRVITLVFLSLTQQSYTVLCYAGAIWISAITWGTILGLGRKSPSSFERFIVASIISPMLCMFVVDTSGHELHLGNARESFLNAEIRPMVISRFVENLVGILLATLLPRRSLDSDNISNGFMWYTFLVASGVYIIGYFWLLYTQKVQDDFEKNHFILDLDSFHFSETPKNGQQIEHREIYEEFQASSTKIW